MARIFVYCNRLGRFRRRAFGFMCLTLLGWMWLASAAQAQIGGIDADPADPGTGGRNTIQGHLYFPSGRMLDRRLRVRLLSLRGGELHTLTDDSGAFTFRRLAGGRYTLAIDAGKEYEPINETIDIIDTAIRRGSGQGGETIMVQYQLRLKAEQTSKPATVNAALSNVPQPALELYGKALQAAQAGDHKKAVSQLKKAISLYPEFMAAFNELGVQLMSLGQLEEAEQALLSAIKVAPAAPQPRFNYGMLLVQKRQFEKAEAELRQALAQEDNSASGHLYLGRALANQHKGEEAEQELLRAVSLGGDEMGLAHRYLAAVYMERGDNPRAVNELEKYLSLSPKAKDAEQIRELIKQLRR